MILILLQKNHNPSGDFMQDKEPYLYLLGLKPACGKRIRKSDARAGLRKVRFGGAGVSPASSARQDYL